MRQLQYHQTSIQPNGPHQALRLRGDTTAMSSLRRLLDLSATAVSGRSLSTADFSACLCRSLSTAAAVSGFLRRPLSTAAASSHPPWAIIDYTTAVDWSSSAPGVCFYPEDPPAVSSIFAPAHLIDPTARPTAANSKVRYLAGNVVQVIFGDVGATSGDGHILLSYREIRAEGPVTLSNLAGNPEVDRFVCNPLTGQILRLPDFGGSRRYFVMHHMGLLTQADGGGGIGCGPPDRFAVAEFVLNGAAIVRFLSEEGKWRTVRPVHGNPSLPRPMTMNQETVAFGGRLWWVDLTLGAVSVDPFADRPEIRFVELPGGSVLPERARADEGDMRKAEENVMFMREVAKHRRIGVSEGRLRYAEVSPHEPFLLSSYVLDDDEDIGVNLEHRVALRQVLADGGYTWRENSPAPQIAVLDPLDASAIYLKVGEDVVVVDMHNGKVIGASPLEEEYNSLVPCVLPPWLGSSRIPTAGKKDGLELT